MEIYNASAAARLSAIDVRGRREVATGRVSILQRTSEPISEPRMLAARLAK
jgi:hypothetical protein